MARESLQKSLKRFLKARRVKNLLVAWIHRNASLGLRTNDCFSVESLFFQGFASLLFGAWTLERIRSTIHTVQER